MISYTRNQQGDLVIESVKLADADNAVHVPDGAEIAPKGSGVRATVGNVYWRSPEAQVGVGINKPSDVFSFGIVVSLPPLQSLHSKDHT